MREPRRVHIMAPAATGRRAQNPRSTMRRFRSQTPTAMDHVDSRGPDLREEHKGGLRENRDRKRPRTITSSSTASVWTSSNGS